MDMFIVSFSNNGLEQRYWHKLSITFIH